MPRPPKPPATPPPSETPPPEADFDEWWSASWPPAGPAGCSMRLPFPRSQHFSPPWPSIARISLAYAPVIVHPDGAIGSGHAIDVYDLARSVGFQKVRFAANVEAG